MARTQVSNTSAGEFSFPAPYSGILAPGASAVLSDAQATVISNLGGAAAIGSGLLIQTVPDSVPVSPHNTNPGAQIDDSTEGSIIPDPTSGKLKVGILQTDAQHGVRGGGTQHAAATTGVNGFQAAADKLKQDTDLSAPQALSGPGAVNVTTRTTLFTSTAAGNALTLANGAFTGQRKSVYYTAEAAGADTGVLTPATPGNLATVTFNALRDWVELEWSGTVWNVASFGGAAIA